MLSQATGMDTLTIRHQDGDLTYRLKHGGYAIHEGLITVSVETIPTIEDQSPECALFSLVDALVSGELREGMTLQARSVGAEPTEGTGVPNAYFSFHAEKVAIRWTVREVLSDRVIFGLDAEHDDVNYYDQRARPTITTGLFALPRRSRDELWVPV